MTYKNILGNDLIEHNDQSEDFDSVEIVRRTSTGKNGGTANSSSKLLELKSVKSNFENFSSFYSAGQRLQSHSIF
jgi:hypothetical protein